MSAKDLCTIPFLEKLMDFDSFKIEGRNRSPEYVSTVVKVYRKAIDLAYENKLTKEIKEELMEELKTVYNRGFSNGFYLGKPINEFTDEYGSKATTKKEFVGKIVNYYSKNNVAEIIVESNTFEKGNKLMIQGNKTGVQEFIVEEIMQNEKSIENCERGEVTIKIPFKVRKNDEVYIIEKR